MTIAYAPFRLEQYQDAYGIMGYLLTLVEFFAGIVAAVFLFNFIVMIRIPARIRKAELLFEQDDVGFVERGEQNVSIDSLVRFSAALKVKLADLFADAGL